MKRAMIGLCAVAALGALPTAAQGQTLWSDNFDSYPVGPLGSGVGGWLPWWLDPGSLGYTVTTDEAHSAPNSLMTTGPQDATREYSGITSGVISFTTWVYVPGTMTDSQYWILLNTHDNATSTSNWSLDLQLDAGAGEVIDDAGNSTALIVDQWVLIEDIIDLERDQQTISYGGTPISTVSWTENASAGGQLALEAVDLWANNSTSPVYWDTMSIDVVPAFGACCINDGTCLPLLSPEECTTAGGEYQGHGSLCEAIDCPVYGPCGWIQDAPFSWSDDTTGQNDDCNVEATDSPDVLFEVNLPFDARWVFSVCDAQFDSVIMVDADCCGNTYYNDDGPGCGVGSELTIDLAAGTYFVVVEGTSEFDVGAFTLNVFPTCADGPFAYACDPGSAPEGEPTCGPEYVDVFNSGCNADPGSQNWSPIACDDVICGESGVFSAGGGTSRDTDWYEFTLASATDIVYAGAAEFDMQMLIIQPGGPTFPARCDDLIITHSSFPEACVPSGATIEDNLAAGDWWLWAGPDASFVATCGDNYEISLTCGGAPPCPEDVNGDGQVNITDLLAVLAAWGPCAGCPEDINGDGVVNITDLLAVLAAWGPCP